MGGCDSCFDEEPGKKEEWWSNIRIIICRSQLSGFFSNFAEHVPVAAPVHHDNPGIVGIGSAVHQDEGGVMGIGSAVHHEENPGVMGIGSAVHHDDGGSVGIQAPTG